MDVEFVYDTTDRMLHLFHVGFDHDNAARDNRPCELCPTRPKAEPKYQTDDYE